MKDSIHTLHILLRIIRESRYPWKVMQPLQAGLKNRRVEFKKNNKLLINHYLIESRKMIRIKLSHSFLTLAFVFVGLFPTASCSSENKAASDTQNALNNIANSENTDSDQSGDNTCLLGYLEKYDQLLTEKEVLDATGFSSQSMETKYKKVLKNPANHSFEYKFENRRVGKVFGLDREMELKDIISISSIKPMSLNQFKNAYRPATEAEMAKAKESLNEVADGKSSNADANAAMKKAKEQNVSSESVKKVGGGMLDIFKEVAKANTDVAGIGDAAVWNTATDDLFVLKGGVKFEIKANVSNDGAKNKSVALELARKVLARCK